MILKGKPVADTIKNEIKREIKGNEISLAIIAVGRDGASDSYIKGVVTKSEKIGINVKLIRLSENITDKNLIEKIHELNVDKDIHGIMVQMPLPDEINKSLVLDEILPSKDVDCLTDINMGKIIKDKRNGLAPCTPLAIIKLLDYYNIEIEGKDIVVIGRSSIVGKPVAGLLTNRNATVTLCHSRTKNLKEKIKKADIAIVAVGKKHFLKEDFVHKDLIVIDVGIHFENGKLYGDVDYQNIKDNVKAITPVPGGIGSITNTILVSNTIKSHNLLKG